MKVMTVSLPCRAHSGLHAGICELPISPPDPSHGPRCIAGRLRRRGAVGAEQCSAKPRPRPRKGGGEIRESLTRLSH